jgi:uncharacterized membrane protein
MDSNYLTPNFQLRQNARKALTENWGNAVLVTLIYFLITLICGFNPVVEGIVCLVISGPLMLGWSIIYLRLVRESQKPRIETLFEGFNNFKSAFVLNLLIGVFVFLWSLLFIIPGIIAGISYSQAFFILVDEPEIGAYEAIKKSKQMMMGKKGKYFMLSLSFLGWALLCVVTLGMYCTKGCGCRKQNFRKH